VTLPRRAALVGLALAWACGAEPALPDPSSIVGDDVTSSAVEDPRADVSVALDAFEAELRAAIDPATVPPWPSRAGADPFAVLAVRDDRALGLVRGQGAIVLLDADARELARIDGPAQPVAIAAGPDGQHFVVGETPDWRDGDEPGSTIATVRAHGDRLALQRWRIPHVIGLRDVAWADPGTLVLADRHGGRILAVRWPPGGPVPRSVCPQGRSCAPPLEVHELARCEGAIDVAVHGRLVVGVCLLERALVIGELDARGTSLVGETRIVRHGPHWAAAVAPLGDGWLVAATSVEDKPLDREDGAFGWVDPFVTLDEVRRCAEGLCVSRRASVNVGEHGVVMPKWIDVAVADDRVVVDVTGYGADRVATLELSTAAWEAPRVVTSVVPPGLRMLATLAGERRIGADPLLDRWVVLDAGGTRTVAVPGPEDPRGVDERIGEALVFTHLLAPGASSAGKRSRFTCETCHFEGTVDGRVHFTGRGDVHATTKSLLGLFGNRPHFTRALDRTLATMVDNEFAVANRGDPNGADFTVDPTRVPWVRELGATAPMGPVDLRRAMMRFVAGFAHAPNPAVLGRDRFTASEARGAALFRDRCESCHAARTVADDPATRVPFERWESLVLSDTGPIVWASEVRVRTGVEPYVHDEGARPPSLRRMWAKRPYFTDGSAATLDDVLARARVAAAPDAGPSGFVHDGPAPDRVPLAEPERAALRAFIELL